MVDKEHRIYEIPDELWERVKPLLPPTPSASDSGPYMDARKAMAIVFHVLREGNKLERVMDNLGGEGTALQNRIEHWLRTGTFDRLWQVGIITLDELKMLVKIIMK